MDYVPALNEARRAFLDSIEGVCQEVDDLDIALRAYHDRLEACGYVIVPLEPTSAMTSSWAHREGIAFQGTSAQHAHAREVYQGMLDARQRDVASMALSASAPSEENTDDR